MPVQSFPLDETPICVALTSPFFLSMFLHRGPPDPPIQESSPPRNLSCATYQYQGLLQGSFTITNHRGRSLWFLVRLCSTSLTVCNWILSAGILLAISVSWHPLFLFYIEWRSFGLFGKISNYLEVDFSFQHRVHIWNWNTNSKRGHLSQYFGRTFDSNCRETRGLTWLNSITHSVSVRRFTLTNMNFLTIEINIFAFLFFPP